MMTSDKEAANEWFEDNYELTDYPQWGYSIHIAKTSGGWKPLFQKNEYYSTIAELRGFYERNKDLLYIENEYGVEKAWEDIEYIINDNTGKRRYNIDCCEYSYDKDSGIEFIKRVMDIDKDIIELTNKEILLLSK